MALNTSEVVSDIENDVVTSSNNLPDIYANSVLQDLQSKERFTDAVVLGFKQLVDRGIVSKQFVLDTTYMSEEEWDSMFSSSVVQDTSEKTADLLSPKHSIALKPSLDRDYIRKELDLIDLFFARGWRPVERQEIVNLLWEEATDNDIQKIIHRLRWRLNDGEMNWYKIVTINSVGYMLIQEEENEAA